MNRAPLSLILVPTLDCNVTCDYCFEERSRVRLTPSDLVRVTTAILDYLETIGTNEAEVYWQGGEVMLLGPAWFEAADRSMGAAAAARECQFHHYLQSNLIGYGPHWNPVIRSMFGGSVGTSMDFPNDYRRLKNGSGVRYTEAWLEAVAEAQRGGLDVSVIAVVHQGSLGVSADEFLGFFADRARVNDVQLNLPFPGGPGKGGDILDPLALSRFLVEVLDTWMARYRERGLRLAPFGELIEYYLGRPARLPCIWQPNCANEFVTIDARGRVALCDCWVASYPQHAFGDLFASPSLAALLDSSDARRALLERPERLMDNDDCDRCPHLALCHGGCPVRTLASKSTIFARDPYCEVYKVVFEKCRDLAGSAAIRRPGQAC